MFLWPPVLWAARMLLLILMAGAAWICALLLLPFLRWRHVKQLALGRLPVVREVGGSAEVLGQKLAANAVLDRPLAPSTNVSDMEHALRDLQVQLSKVEQAQEALSAGTFQAIELLKAEVRQWRDQQ